MHQQTIALYATNTMTDWEYAHIATQITRAEQAKPGRFQLLVVGDGTAPVNSLGGFPVFPAKDIAELIDDPSVVSLILPGTDYYAQEHTHAIDTIQALLDRGVHIAAIGTATVVLARSGLLNTRHHTSNDRSFLQVGNYQGDDFYVNASAITDQGITTAHSLCPLDFTKEIICASKLMPEAVAQAWYQLHTLRNLHALQGFTAAWDTWASTTSAQHTVAL